VEEWNILTMNDSMLLETMEPIPWLKIIRATLVAAAPDLGKEGDVPTLSL
jgi:hypothetical protein